MNILPNLTQISDALGWVVLHSLWQGALAAVLVWGFRSLTRESAPDTRYLFGFITLCLLLAAFIGTFLYYFNLGGIVGEAGASTSETITFALPNTVMSPSGNPLLRVTDYTALVGTIWAFCFGLLGLRYLSAFRLTHKLRTSSISDIPANWQVTFNQLAKRSNVTGKVRGFISEHVSSPITFGFWKPIVLLPAWFFTGMSTEQCEAVLLHEFAHIRRHDYMANILQILVKTVLFYHPAVQYISKTINADREHACDDFAVLVTNNPEILAKALGTIRIKAARDGGVFALSANGPEAPLMHRLKRLMGTPVKNSNSGSGRGYAATLMILIAGTAILGLGATESVAHPHKQDADSLAGAAPSTPKVWDKFIDDTITLNGNTYISTPFTVHSDGGGYYIINGNSYPSKYSYNVYAKDGKNYVVKRKNGKRYMEIGDNWFRIDSGEKSKQKYTYGTSRIDGKKYKTKTNTAKNQTFIKINNKWYDIDETDLDRIIPTPPASPASPASPYSYAYAFKDGQKYKIKTKNKTGKSYILMDGKWQKTSTNGGKDHGHRHINIDGKWVNIDDSHDHKDGKTYASPFSWINDEVRAKVEEAVTREVEANIRAEEAAVRKGEAIVRAQEAEVRQLEQVERAEEARVRADERRQYNQDRAEALRERTAARAEHDLERSEAKREAAYERAREQHEREHALHDISEDQHAKLAKKQTKNYEKMRSKLTEQLTTDGYLNSGTNKVTMDMTPTDIFINGRKLDDKTESKYCDIVSKYGLRKDGRKRIVIKPGYFHVKINGKHNNSSYTHND